MVCINQETAEKNEEPFVTLTKTRRIGGRVLFGQHAMHLPLQSRGERATIKVGDRVKVWEKEEQEPVEEISVLAEKFLAVASSTPPVVEVQLKRRWFFNSF
jgi:molybdenum cofactor sulfurtransferase